MDAGLPPIAYVCARYPAISHTFVLREIQALRALGHEIVPFAIRRAVPEDLLSEVDRDENARTQALLPTTPLRLVGALAGLLRRRRGARALAVAARRAWSLRPPGVRGSVWQGFYLAESVLLWSAAQRSGVRHLHAHFANVAADVALLTATLGTALEPARPWSWSFTMHAAEFWNAEAHRLPQKAASAAFVACISDFARSQMMALVAPDHWDRLHVVHCGVVPADYQPARGTGDGTLRLVNVGRLVPVKGHRLLLDLAEELRERDIASVVTIIGDGPERAALEEAITNRGLDGVVRLMGAIGQDEIPRHLESSDVFVMPSFYEGVPVSAMEAMAAGLPVVASRIAGFPELIEDGVNGRLITPARLGEFVEAVAALAADPDERVRLGAAARATVKERFDARVEARTLARVFAAHVGPDPTELPRDGAGVPLISARCSDRSGALSRESAGAM